MFYGVKKNNFHILVPILKQKTSHIKKIDLKINEKS